MRKIVVGEFVSLDGVMEGPGPYDNFELAGWTTPYFSDDITNVLAGNMMNTDTMLLGRVTYESFAAAFSAQSGGLADFLNNVPKFVVSTTLKQANWNNSTLISANVIEEITRLKQQSGKDIFINGSGTLVHSLMKHNLIDEYSLLLYPVTLGKGKRLFPDGFRSSMKLVNSKAFDSGVAFHHYKKT